MEVRTDARCTAAVALLALAVVGVVGCGPGDPRVRDAGTGAPRGPAVTVGVGEDAVQAARRHRLVWEVVMVQGITDRAVLEAMDRVPRHLFVPETHRDQAYGDHPLPIGFGQTISQPYIVGLMTEALRLQPGSKILEVGTGSGYQAAVLSALGMDVFSVEIIAELAERGAANLAAAGFPQVRIRHGDGYFGWPEEAPFDAIIVTAAPDHVPPPLQAQLRDGGRMVIPVGPVGGYQELWLIERSGDAFDTHSLGGVAFVPFTREER